MIAVAAPVAPFYCLLGHQHRTERARRGCDLFGRAVDRFERIDARYGGRRLMDADDRGFALWRHASRLVNDLFGVAMSDLNEGDRR